VVDALTSPAAHTSELLVTEYQLLHHVIISTGGAMLKTGAKFSIFGSDLTNKNTAGTEARKNVSLPIHDLPFMTANCMFKTAEAMCASVCQPNHYVGPHLQVAASFLGRTASSSNLPPHRSTSNMGAAGKSFVFGTMDHSSTSLAHTPANGESQHGKDTATAGHRKGPGAAAGAKPPPASFTGVRSMVGTGSTGSGLPGPGGGGMSAAHQGHSNKGTALLSLLQQQEASGRAQQASWTKALQGLGGQK
jgi:hypothetical protein